MSRGLLEAGQVHSEVSVAFAMVPYISTGCNFFKRPWEGLARILETVSGVQWLSQSPSSDFIQEQDFSRRRRLGAAQRSEGAMV